jgi:uncharacterized protein
MTRSIDRDVGRFKQILRGKVRENLRKYITHGEMMGRTGRELVSIPVPAIDIPHFRHGQKGSGGVGQGEGEVGQPVGKGQGQEGDGKGQAGDQPGGHVREVEISLDELADMLGDVLKLPNIQPKGKDSLKSRKDRYTSIRQAGPDSLRHFKRTFKRALKRQVTLDDYNYDNPVVIPMREDERFRSWKTVTEPEANAAVLYIMDVSGSMTDDQKEIVRIESFWIDTWLKRQYDGVQRRYIVHDAAAHEVDEDTFYRTRESGGTRISSAYQVAWQVILRDFPPSDWNIYCFQFSDGDNWGEDNEGCLKFLTADLLPSLNLFCYGQVESPYGSGDYIRELRKLGDKFDNLILSEIDGKEAIYDSIKEFLGTGK